MTKSVVGMKIQYFRCYFSFLAKKKKRGGGLWCDFTPVKATFEMTLSVYDHV